MRIGEILVREGQLTRQQLAQALRVQGLLGSRLGTTLLEESLIAEDTLLDAVGRQRSTHTVSSAELANVPPEVVRMIPARLAERYGVVPFQLKGRTLSVASKDAGDLLKEDEIGFLTSCMVRTCVGLEFRIHEALERYYRIPSPERHQALARRFALQAKAARPPAPSPGTTAASAPQARSPSSATNTAGNPAPATPASPPAAPAPPPAAPVPPAAVPAPRAPRGQPRFIELDEEDAALLGTSSSDSWSPESDEQVLLKPAPLPWLAREAARGEQAAPAEAPPAAIAGAAPASPAAIVGPTTAPPTEAAPTEAAPTEVAPTEASPAPPSATAGEAPGEALAGSPLELEDQLRQASAGLRDVEIRDDIADVLLAFCRPHFRRRVILVARKHHIVGWRGEGEGVESERARTIDIPAHDPSVFLGLTGAGSFWLGSLPALPANQALVDGLGGALPKECVVLPVILRSRVVCYIYGDNLDGGVAGAPIAELRRLAAKAGLAFEVYILKNKLRML